MLVNLQELIIAKVNFQIEWFIDGHRLPPFQQNEKNDDGNQKPSAKGGNFRSIYYLKRKLQP